MNILIYRWKVFNQQDIKEAFEYFGHKVEYYEEPVKVIDEAGHRYHNINELTRIFGEYDIIFSVNYFTHVSDLCEKLGKKYVSWTVDSPLITMYNRSIFNKCNYCFVFDKYYYYQFKGMKVKHVYYLPLAVNAKRIQTMLEDCMESDLEKYSGEISFVGSLYHRNSYDKIKDKLTPYLRGYFDAVMNAQLNIYGDNIMENMLNVDILSKLMEITDFKQDEDAFSDISLVFSSTFLGFKLASMERIKALNLLAKKHQVKLYSDEEDDELINVKHCGSVSYMEDMPKVFNKSSINMNFTIRNIRTGIPLRAWDVLGAGGFLLTNFQAELTEYFENGKDLVFYESLDDMERKADYYMAHEDERISIANNGLKNVMEKHSYIDRIEKILQKLQ